MKVKEITTDQLAKWYVEYLKTLQLGRERTHAPWPQFAGWLKLYTDRKL